MKIVILADDFPPRSLGGAGFSAYKQALSLFELGHEVSVITTSRDPKDAGVSEYNGLKIFTLVSNYHPRWRAYKSLYNSSVLPKIESILKELQPDVVHANNIHTHLSYHSLVLGKKYAKVAVWTARDVMSFTYGKLKTPQYIKNLDYRTTWLDHIKLARKRWNPFRNFIIRKYLRSIDARFAVSYALKDALEQNGIKNIEVLHTGADTEFWEVKEDKVTEYRKKFGVENKKVILFGGRLSAAKGGDKAIAALEKIIKEVPNAVLLIAGKIDEYTKTMQDEAEKMGLKDKLIFTGWISEDEMRYAYACADVVLVPSIIFDSLPRLVVEAMAAGKPVIGTWYGGTKEIIVEGETGYVINPFNIDLMAGRVVDLLKNPDKAKRFGDTARKRIMTDFNLKTKALELAVRYKQLIKGNDN